MRDSNYGKQESENLNAMTFAMHCSAASLSAIFLLTSFAPNVRAQSAAPGSEVILEGIVVEGSSFPSDVAVNELTGSTGDVNSAGATATEQARERLAALAGGTALISNTDMVGRANANLADTLSTVPGVVIQDFFGGNDQPRVQIRGSGLQQNPVERGILMLQDGLPLNRADGSYVVGLADPRQAQFTEIYRGYTANRLGATVLGGAINFTSPTGSSAPGSSFGIEGGSFGQLTTFARSGVRQGDLDGHAQISWTQRDGYRDHNESRRLNANLNAGAKINSNVSTRLFFGYTDLAFDVVGPLTREDLKSNPRQSAPGPTVVPNPAFPPPPPFLVTNPGPNVPRDKPRRETEQFRVGSRTTFTSGAHLMDVVLGYSYTDDLFVFPISGSFRYTEGGDFTGVMRYAYRPDRSQPLPLFEMTAQYSIGTADRERYLNISGNQGAQFADSELDATTLSIFSGMNVPLGAGFTLKPGISYSHATRDNDDNWTDPTRPVARFHPLTGQRLPDAATPAQDTSFSRTYKGWTPSIGVMYQVVPDNTFFTAFSRSFEPPTHNDLLSTINGTPFASAGSPGGFPPSARDAFATPDLEAQTASTIEGGWRGRNGDFSWDVVTYYSWVENELLNLRDTSGVSLGSVNADKTTHFGVELGLAARFTDELSGRIAYTYQDFRFDGDNRHGDNRLAGAPKHTINAALRYAFTPSFFVEGEINWRPDEMPVDNANTLFVDRFIVVNLRNNYMFTENFSLYGEVRNVFDENYASSNLVVDTSRQDQAAFIPGDGRAFIIGIKGQF